MTVAAPRRKLAARRERSSQLGAVEYLTKPIAPEALIAAVARHLPS